MSEIDLEKFAIDMGLRGRPQEAVRGTSCDSSGNVFDDLGLDDADELRRIAEALNQAGITNPKIFRGAAFVMRTYRARIEALEAEVAKLLELAGELAGAELNYRTALSTPGYHRTADEALELLRQAGEKMRDWSYQQEQLAAIGEKP